MAGCENAAGDYPPLAEDIESTPGHLHGSILCRWLHHAWPLPPMQQSTASLVTLVTISKWEEHDYHSDIYIFYFTFLII